MGKAITFLLLLLISPAVYAQSSHTVGGSSRWTTGPDYNTWASGQTFTVGDSLVFNYGPSHTVDEVNEADYTSCNNGNLISSNANSPTTISLTAVGTRYFICGQSNHCDQGMKLAVTVSGGTSPSTPPPSGGSTPSPPSGGETPSPPSGGETPSPPSTTRSSPPPPKGNAASSLGGGKSLMLVLVAMLGVNVMG